ncbi:MAG TPA: response regulator [Candidatus Methylomirabilis sp.]|nr:response regulator [Candidatus Methylomirabilis sp.]
MKTRLRILIIDDERIVCERLTHALEKFGFEVEAYTDSQQALDRIAGHRFDVLVTDIKMRGPSGIDVLHFVRENHPHTKVIVITGFATVETAREVMKGGAVDFIPKPFRMSQLRDLILRIAEEQPGQAPAGKTTGPNEE